MKKLLMLLCLMVTAITALYPQDVSTRQPDKWVSYLHLESGFMNPSGTIRENISIRQNISAYYVYQSSISEPLVISASMNISVWLS